MATDQSPPRINAIIAVAVGMVVVLIGLKFVFDSYFTYTSEAAAHAKLAEPTALKELHAQDKKNLESSPVPIAAAMAEMAKNGRAAGGPELVEPKPSDDLTPMTGWAKSPRNYTLPAPTLHVDGDAGATPNAGDGGAPLVDGDAGATPNAADGGAAHHGHDGGAGHHPRPHR